MLAASTIFPLAATAVPDGGQSGCPLTDSPLRDVAAEHVVGWSQNSPRRFEVPSPAERLALFAIMGGVLSVKMNDAAVELLGALDGLAATEPPGGLATGLRERIALGISRRGNVLTWATSVGGSDAAPSYFNDLTGWECSDSSFHLEDSVAVDVETVDGAPVISQEDQRTLLLHGLSFALAFSRLVYALDPPSPVRCVVGANETNATFRFHQIRPGESWNLADLDGYRQDKMIVLDIEPAGA